MLPPDKLNPAPLEEADGENVYHPRVKFSPQMLLTIDYLVAGYTISETSNLLQKTKDSIHRDVRALARQIGGFHLRPGRVETARAMRSRVITWRAKQIGVLEYLAGIRGPDGRTYSEYEIPETNPVHVNHRHLFPLRKPRCPHTPRPAVVETSHIENSVELSPRVRQSKTQSPPSSLSQSED